MTIGSQIPCARIDFRIASNSGDSSGSPNMLAFSGCERSSSSFRVSAMSLDTGFAAVPPKSAGAPSPQHGLVRCKPIVEHLEQPGAPKLTLDEHPVRQRNRRVASLVVAYGAEWAA